MKKRSMRIFMCTTLAVLALSFNACGDKDTSKSTSDSTSVSSKSSVDTKSVSNSSDSKSSSASSASSTSTGDLGLGENGKFATISDFVNSDIMKGQVETLKSSLEGSGMEIELSGEDNKLIYTYTYLEVEKTDGMAETLASGIEAQADQFKSVASTIKTAVEVENPVVVVKYVDANGEEIYSKEFAAE